MAAPAAAAAAAAAATSLDEAADAGAPQWQPVSSQASSTVAPTWWDPAATDAPPLAAPQFPVAPPPAATQSPVAPPVARTVTTPVSWSQPLAAPEPAADQPDTISDWSWAEVAPVEDLAESHAPVDEPALGEPAFAAMLQPSADTIAAADVAAQWAFAAGSPADSTPITDWTQALAVGDVDPQAEPLIFHDWADTLAETTTVSQPDAALGHDWTAYATADAAAPAETLPNTDPEAPLGHDWTAYAPADGFAAPEGIDAGSLPQAPLSTSAPMPESVRAAATHTAARHDFAPLHEPAPTSYAATLLSLAARDSHAPRQPSTPARLLDTDTASCPATSATEPALDTDTASCPAISGTEPALDTASCPATAATVPALDAGVAAFLGSPHVAAADLPGERTPAPAGPGTDWGFADDATFDAGATFAWLDGAAAGAGDQAQAATGPDGSGAEVSPWSIAFADSLADLSAPGAGEPFAPASDAAPTPTAAFAAGEAFVPQPGAVPEPTPALATGGFLSPAHPSAPEPMAEHLPPAPQPEVAPLPAFAAPAPADPFAALAQPELIPTALPTPAPAAAAPVREPVVSWPAPAGPRWDMAQPARWQDQAPLSPAAPTQAPKVLATAAAVASAPTAVWGPPEPELTVAPVAAPRWTDAPGIDVKDGTEDGPEDTAEDAPAPARTGVAGWLHGDASPRVIAIAAGGAVLSVAALALFVTPGFLRADDPEPAAAPTITLPATAAGLPHAAALDTRSARSLAGAAAAAGASGGRVASYAADGVKATVWAAPGGIERAAALSAWKQVGGTDLSPTRPATAGGLRCGAAGRGEVVCFGSLGDTSTGVVVSGAPEEAAVTLAARIQHDLS